MERRFDHISHDLDDDHVEVARLLPSGDGVQLSQARETALQPRSIRHTHSGRKSAPNIQTDLPRRLAPLKGELAIWRAFLSEEIDAIMRGEE